MSEEKSDTKPYLKNDKAGVRIGESVAAQLRRIREEQEKKEKKDE